MNDRRHNSRTVRAPRGAALTARSWQTEAPLRMLMNNLDPEVAENPHELVVYGGIGRAARTWQDFDRIVASLKSLAEDETLLVQSGKPVGVFRTHADAPRVLIANSNLVPHWANWDHFNELDRKGLAMYGQMTAGSWIYIGTQGIVQGTYETFVEAGRQHYDGSLKGRWILTAGLGGMVVLVFISRARAFADRRQAVALVCGAAAGFCVGVVREVCNHTGSAALLWGSLVLFAFGALGLAAALLVPVTAFTPLVRIVAEWLELIATAVALPLAAWIDGLFSWVRMR